MTVELFRDGFNRPNGGLGGSWVTSPAGHVVVSENAAAATSWDAIALVDIGRNAGYRLSASFSKKEWPGLLFRSAGSGTPDYWLVRSGGMELVSRGDGRGVIQGPVTDGGGVRTIWVEVREKAEGTEIKWGWGATTSGTYLDTKSGRPAGTMVGFLTQNGQSTVDDFMVEELADVATTTTTTTTTLPPPPLAMIGDVPVTAAFLGDVPVLSLLATTPRVTTTTTTVTNNGEFTVGDSILHPVYVGEGSVLQRDVSSMPLASNSAAMAAYMRQDQINTGYGTAFNLYQYNFPTYVVRSSEFTQFASVTWRELRQWGWTPDWMMGTVFSEGPHDPQLNTAPFAPIPEYAVPAVGTDSSIAIYDADTDTLWEWWQMIKTGPYQWAAEWGSKTVNASTKYSVQADFGSVCAAGLMGSLMQIGIGEAQAGEIRHALGLVILAPKRGFSWPARQDDGWVDDVNAPTQGQWFRLNPGLNVDAQPWNPLLKMVCRAVQKYGATCFDKGGAVAWTGESSADIVQRTGVDPWQAILADAGMPEWQVFHDFPWEATQWAPIDWGKP